MDANKLKALLESVKSGGTNVEKALEELRNLPFADLGYAVVDHHRALRQGVPEVILGEGKNVPQIVGIATELSKGGGNVLITRLSPEKAAEAKNGLPALQYNALSKTGTIEQSPIPRLGTRPVALVSAGTSDMPVAEECAETLRMLGVGIERVFDVGVSGIHRLLHRKPTLEQASVVVVVAGMEGALPSVVGGLVDVPVIAVPTSIGYGAALSGFTALMCMLTSCASGVSVVNIDNGFGAAFAAARILRGQSKS